MITLRQFAEANKMTIYDLAIKCRVTTGTMYKYADKISPDVRIDTLERVYQGTKEIDGVGIKARDLFDLGCLK